MVHKCFGIEWLELNLSLADGVLHTRLVMLVVLVSHEGWLSLCVALARPQIKLSCRRCILIHLTLSHYARFDLRIN